MKTIILFSIFLLCFARANTQVRIQPQAEEGYETRIRTFIENLKVIDTHEHFRSPTRMQEYSSYDFMLLLRQYSRDDIISSGLPHSKFNILLKDSLSVISKWEIIKPYWEKAFNTAYCRNTLYASSKLFGVNVFNDSTIIVLSDKIKMAYQNDNWFYDVLDKSKIELVIQDGSDRSFRDDKFRYVVRFDRFINLQNKNSINNLSKELEIVILTLDDLLMALDKTFETALKFFKFSHIPIS